jgi:hypothetical protein
MSPNAFLNDSETGGKKYELGGELRRLVTSMNEIKTSAENIHRMDDRYGNQITGGMGSIKSVGEEARGNYSLFGEIRENASRMQSEIIREMDKSAQSTRADTQQIDTSEVQKILEGITDENKGKRIAALLKVQDRLSAFYHSFAKERFESLNTRNHIRDSVEETVSKGISVNRRALEEEQTLKIKDERITTVARKFRSRTVSFAEFVGTINSKAQTFEAENLEHMEENFKEFNRLVTTVKNKTES